MNEAGDAGTGRTREVSVPVTIRGRIRMLVHPGTLEDWTAEMIRSAAAEELADIGGAIVLRSTSLVADIDTAEIGETEVLSFCC